MSKNSTDAEDWTCCGLGIAPIFNQKNRAEQSSSRRMTCGGGEALVDLLVRSVRDAVDPAWKLELCSMGLPLPAPQLEKTLLVSSWFSCWSGPSTVV